MLFQKRIHGEGINALTPYSGVAVVDNFRNWLHCETSHRRWTLHEGLILELTITLII